LLIASAPDPIITRKAAIEAARRSHVGRVRSLSRADPRLPSAGPILLNAGRTWRNAGWR
jgi:hypothetical protein